MVGSIIASSLTPSQSVSDIASNLANGEEDAILDQQVFLPLFHKSGDPSTAFRDADEDAISAAMATTVPKYYFFGGQRIGMQKGSSFYYLHSDHLGSTLMETATNSQIARYQRYFSYGDRRAGSTHPLHTTDNRFTGQKLDTTGLMYYNARYYDPILGHFVSPDSIVPNPTNVLDYNRFLYVQANPLNLSDPSGHICIWDINVRNTCEGGTDWDAVQLSLDAAGLVEPTPFADGRCECRHLLGTRELQ